MDVPHLSMAGISMRAHQDCARARARALERLANCAHKSGVSYLTAAAHKHTHTESMHHECNGMGCRDDSSCRRARARRVPRAPLSLRATSAADTPASRVRVCVCVLATSMTRFARALKRNQSAERAPATSAALWTHRRRRRRCEIDHIATSVWLVACRRRRRSTPTTGGSGCSGSSSGSNAHSCDNSPTPKER